MKIWRFAIPLAILITFLSPLSITVHIFQLDIFMSYDEQNTTFTFNYTYPDNYKVSPFFKYNILQHFHSNGPWFGAKATFSWQWFLQSPSLLSAFFWICWPWLQCENKHAEFSRTSTWRGTEWSVKWLFMRWPHFLANSSLLLTWYTKLWIFCYFNYSDSPICDCINSETQHRCGGRIATANGFGHTKPILLGQWLVYDCITGMAFAMGQ